ncbi:hypothetical protein NM688_g9318 [Phlebia brevispora]|uniref:Uncharacterized protein n=1 Tax=Phlebia brevispora TaxID=194682 RepID=A0ACC1RIY6_9APHY|nr:hypothetical protein NM688_g9318 [Phlebia brevispora]
MPRSKKHKSAASQKVSQHKLQPPAWANSHSEASGVREPVQKTLGPDAVTKDAEATLARFGARAAATTQANWQAIENNRPQLEHEVPAFLSEPHMDVNMVLLDTAGAGDEEDSERLRCTDEYYHHCYSYLTLRTWRGRWKTYQKTWKERKTRQAAAWDEIIDYLVDIHLHTRYPFPYSVSTTDIIEPTTPPPAILNFVEYDNTAQYTINVFCIWTLEREVSFTRKLNSTSPALELMSLGYVAKTPTRPTVAVSMRTLQLLYRLRQRKASFSIEAFAKVICDYYNIPFRRHMREVVADTFEIYLRIIRAVDMHVRKALGWDSPDWRVKNACRAVTRSVVRPI